MYHLVRNLKERVRVRVRVGGKVSVRVRTGRKVTPSNVWTTLSATLGIWARVRVRVWVRVRVRVRV